MVSKRKNAALQFIVIVRSSALLSSDLLLDVRGSGQLHVTVRTGRHPLVELVICIGTNQPPPPTLSRHCHSTLMMGDRNKISQASNVGSRIATEK